MLKRRKTKRKIRIKRKTKPNKKQIKPKIGDKVKITIKPYIGKTTTGTVERVLTKKKYHSRGHKVRLTSGKIGRVMKIIKKKMKGGLCRHCKNCGKKILI